MKTDITFVVIEMVTAIVITCAGTMRAGIWTQKADMPTARLAPQSEVVNGKIYVISGIYANLQKVEEYDPATDTWAAKADMPTRRAIFAHGVVNGKIYAIGGEGSLGASARATVEEYDPSTDTWIRKADMPTPRARSSASVVDGKIYVFGGGTGGGSSYPVMSTVEAYDPATDTWTRKADMSGPRELLTTSVVDGKIYAIGGQREEGAIRDVYPTVEMYDPATDTWTKKTDAPLPRKVHSACVLNDIIYVFGGRNVIGGWPQSTLFKYDPATDTWAAREDMPYEVAAATASTVDGRFYLIGGSSTWPPNQVISTVWEYDTGPTVDFNGDGIVDSADMRIMVDHWHTNYPLCDIAPAPFGDSFVDVQDLIFLSEHLFEEVNDPTLVAHWALDETEGIFAGDSAGSNDAVVLGGATWQSDTGQVNGALQLNGVDGYAIAGAVLNPADGPFSVLAWIKGGTAGQVIISEPGGANWLGTDPLDGRLMTGLVPPPVGRFITQPMESESIITDGQWHRIGFVWDSSYRHLYVDGIEVVKDAAPLSNLEGSYSGLYIGAGNAMAPGTYFSGLIDDVRIYNRVVSP